MIYKVYASLKNDTNEGRVWLNHSAISGRSVVGIRNNKNRKTIYCEALLIDENYVKDYNSGNTRKICNSEPIITINHWYRDRLGIEETNRDYDLTILPGSHILGHFLSCLKHPQIVARVATWMSIFSLLLGIIGFILVMMSLYS
jgi:hypothetical protein